MTWRALSARPITLLVIDTRYEPSIVELDGILWRERDEQCRAGPALALMLWAGSPPTPPALVARTSTSCPFFTCSNLSSTRPSSAQGPAAALTRVYNPGFSSICQHHSPASRSCSLALSVVRERLDWLQRSPFNYDLRPTASSSLTTDQTVI